MVDELFDLVLLKIEQTARPLYFVIRAPRGEHNNPESDAYFFDEGTCPTNWMRDVVAVISGGDEDPHGFATFVRRIQPPPGMDGNGNMANGHTGDLFTALFPETK